jgi:hypothetical protein
MLLGFRLAVIPQERSGNKIELKNIFIVTVFIQENRQFNVVPDKKKDYFFKGINLC